VAGPLQGDPDAGQWLNVAAASDCGDGNGAHDALPTMRPKISTRSSP
jgi:hypothetical protein